MASQNGKHLRGGLGPFVYRVINGKQFVYIKPAPGTMQQTPATVKAANTFGMASSLSSSIRQSLVKTINGFGDWEMKNRLVSAVLKTLIHCRDTSTRLYDFEQDSFDYLEGFDFNIKTTLPILLAAVPSAVLEADSLTVNIPQLLIPKQLKFPGSTFQCKMMVNVSFFRLADGLMAKEPDSQMIVVTKDQDQLQGQQLIFDMPQGCLCIVSVFLEYAVYRKDVMLVINNQKFNPGKIIKAFITPGTYQGNDNRIWLLMKQFDLASGNSTL